MMLHRRSPSVLALTLILALSAVPKSQAAVQTDPLLAQAPSASPAFKLPDSVANDTIVRIDGSTSLESINQALKQRFEQQYSGTRVETNYSGTDAALQALLNGSIDLAALGRPLTDAEKAQGLTAIPIARHKIAIFVSSDSPFRGDITYAQFARIFRGEITNWSKLGAGANGASGAIRLVDRPNNSDTRSALSGYPVFKQAPFQTGTNATQVAEDTTDTVIQNLGTDGIGYAIADQVLDRQEVRIIPMHKTSPTNPAYPFSQSLTYVYKNPANPAVLAFLGFATAASNQQAIEEARAVQAGAVAAAAPSASPDPAAAAAAPPASSDPAAAAAASASPTASPADPPAAPPPTAPRNDWWLLLPLILGIGGLLAWLKSRRRSSPPAPLHPVPPTTPPSTLAERTGSVITADRSTLDRPADLPEASPEIVPAAGIATGALAAGSAAIAAGAGAATLTGLAANTQRDSRIVLTPRSASQAYAYWEAPESNKAKLREQGGKHLKLRLHDVTDLDADANPHSTLQFDVAEADQDRQVPIPVDNRDYVAEIGYLKSDNEWLSLARSAPVRVPAVPAQVQAAEGLTVEAPVEETLAREAPDSALGEAALAGGVAAVGLAAFAASADSIAPVSEPAPAAIPPSQIDLTPRSATEAYAYWEIPDAAKAAMRQQGGEVLLLRICDVTDLDPGLLPHRIQSYRCAETDTNRAVPIAVTDRDYTAEIGYLTREGEWLLLARSNPIRILPAVAAVDPILVESEPVAAESALVEPSPTVIEPATLLQPPFEQPLEPPIESTAALEPAAELIEPAIEAEPIAELPAEPLVAADLEPSAPAELPPEAALGSAAAGVFATQAFPRGSAEAEVPVEPFSTPVEPIAPAAEQVELSKEALASVDDGLPDLPLGYGESRITLMPRDPHWAYAYWDVPEQHKAELRQQGGTKLALRFYDVSNVDLTTQNPHSLQQYYCEEFARDWYLPVPLSDRDYIVEIGYVTEEDRWLMLARSVPVRIPPVYPSDWHEEKFLTIDWTDEIRAQTFYELVPPERRATFNSLLYDRIFGLAEAAEAQQVAGSLFGSMQQVPQAAISSFVLSAEGQMSGVGMSGAGMMSGIGASAMSGVGMMSGMGLYSLSGIGMSGIGLYSTSGIGMSGVGLYSMSGVGMSGMGMYSTSGIGMSGVGLYSMSGVGLAGLSGVGMTSGAGFSGLSMSGIGMMSGAGLYSMSGVGLAGLSGVGMMSGTGFSGVGFSASAPPIRPRQFWLVAEAELIVYGATEPDATVMIGGQPIKLSPEGTFRFQMMFPDGQIDYPILAVAADGEQNRAIHMRFNRETPDRRTNTKEEAVDEWLSEP